MVRDLRILTAIVIVMVIIDAAWQPLVLFAIYVLPDLFRAVIAPVASFVDGAEACFKFATMIVFARWIYVAGANLVEAETSDLEFSPGSRIWWFFVPIAAFFKPFQGMRELWNASHHHWPYEDNVTIVSAWWAAYLLTSFASIIVLVTKDSITSHMTAIGLQSACMVLRAVCAIILLRGIAAAQRQGDGSALSEVFA